METQNKVFNLNIMCDVYANPKHIEYAPMMKLSRVQGNMVSFDKHPFMPSLKMIMWNIQMVRSIRSTARKGKLQL